MSWFEEHKIKKNVKKTEKKVESAERKAELLTGAGDKLTDLADRKDKAQFKVTVEEQYQKALDKKRLEKEISEARSNLYVQRQKLIIRLVRFNKEYKYVKMQPDTPVKRKELKRCSTGAKNAAYALAVVEEAISRLDDIPSEYEWREIMRDLTKGYKMMNAVSVGSDLMTRLAFLWQRAKFDIKGDISVDAMEHYYGRSIDKLLEEQQIDKVAADLLVKDQALDLENEEEIMEAIRWGSIYTIQPGEMAEAAEEQSLNARRHHRAAIYDDPDETYERPMDLDAALDSLPSMM